MKSLFISMLIIGICAGSAIADVSIISNKSVQETMLTKDEIKSIYLGKKLFWKDKSKIRFATLNEGETNKQFLASYVGKTPAQYKIYWEKMVYTGDGMVPVIFNSSESLLKFITTTEGAIGYIDMDTSSVPTEEINTITISNAGAKGQN